MNPTGSAINRCYFEQASERSRSRLNPRGSSSHISGPCRHKIISAGPPLHFRSQDSVPPTHPLHARPHAPPTRRRIRRGGHAPRGVTRDGCHISASMEEKPLSLFNRCLGLFLPGQAADRPSSSAQCPWGEEGRRSNGWIDVWFHPQALEKVYGRRPHTGHIGGSPWKSRRRRRARRKWRQPTRAHPLNRHARSAPIHLGRHHAHVQIPTPPCPREHKHGAKGRQAVLLTVEVRGGHRVTGRDTMVMDASKSPSLRGRIALTPKSDAMVACLFELSKHKEVLCQQQLFFIFDARSH